MKWDDCMSGRSEKVRCRREEFGVIMPLPSITDSVRRSREA